MQIRVLEMDAKVEAAPSSYIQVRSGRFTKVGNDETEGALLAISDSYYGCDLQPVSSFFFFFFRGYRLPDLPCTRFGI
jgi:hypothetical protein